MEQADWENSTFLEVISDSVVSGQPMSQLHVIS